MEKWIVVIGMGEGGRSTKQSIVFNSFSPNGLFRIKGEGDHSFLVPPSEEGKSVELGEGVAPWSVLVWR